MTEREPLRVGVVGLGVGQLHLLSWLAVQGAEAVAIADTDASRREVAGANWSLPAYASLDEVLDHGVDVVDLCTPPAVHEEQVLRCLDAGVHVICEKPLVSSVAACDRLATAADAARAGSGALLVPVLQYRFGEGAARARALVEAGATGRLYAATAETWWRRERAYYDEAPWRGTWAGALGGTVVNHAIHVHDLLCWIGGPLVEVTATTATLVNPEVVETEDVAAAVGRTADGGLVTMSVTLGAATESSRLRWAFEHVTIESSTEAYHPARGPWRFEFRDPETEALATVLWGDLAPPADQYVGQFQAVVDALASDDPAPPVTLADAAATLELVTAWYASARSGRPEALPLAPDHPLRPGWSPQT